MKPTFGVVLVLALACSSEHPAIFVAEAPSGAGGANGTPDDGGGTSGRGVTGSSGRATGGSSGRAAGDAGGRAAGGSSSIRRDHIPGSGGDEFDTGEAGAPTYDLSTFNPDEVYIYGTLWEGQGGLDVVAHWSVPNHYVVGFDGSTNPYHLPIVNGSLLYRVSGAGIHRFVPEFEADWKEMDLRYPKDATSNDPVETTARCQDPKLDDGPFFASPDGRLIYFCRDHFWYEAGKPLLNDITTTGEAIVSFGNDGLVLLRDGLTLMDAATGVQRTPEGAPSEVLFVTARSAKDGFHVVLLAGPNHEQFDLWSVTSAAVATKLGTYPASPTGIDSYRATPMLSSTDELFSIQLDRSKTQLYDVIIRLTLDGRSEVVYTEETNPRVKLHSSALFTGP